MIEILQDRSEEPKSRAAVAYQAVLTMISDKRLPGGTIIEEKRLTEMLGISRTPLREALRQLEGEMLLRRQGKKLVVYQPSEGEIFEILHVRRMLETEAVKKAALHITPAQLDALHAIENKMTEYAEHNPERFWDADTEFHMGIAEASGCSIIGEFIVDLRRRTKPFSRNHSAERVAEVSFEHRAILEALKSRDGVAARRAMQTHLDRARADFILSLNRF